MTSLITHHAFRHATALTAVVWLAACGGDPASLGVATQQVAPARVAAGPADATAAAPADPGARTRAGRYATAPQAEQTERTQPGRVIAVEVGGDADADLAISQAVEMVYAQQAIQDLPRDAPIFVRGLDLRRAATAANRLQEAGYTRVFLVTP